jgi:starch synthase
VTDAERPLQVLIFDRGIVNPYSLGLAGGLTAAGANVVVAGPARSGKAGVVAVYPRGPVQGQRLRKAADGIVGFARLIALMVRFRPDVLHFQWAMPHDYALLRLLRPFTRARIVFTVHNPVPRDSGYRWHGPMVGAADVLIVHGLRLREDLRRTYSVPDNRIHVVPHGNFEHAAVRTERVEARRALGLPVDGPVFTFFGQLLPRKGIDTLADAFRLHCEHGRAGTLLFAGPSYGIDENDLQRRIEPFGARVHWMTGSSVLPAPQLDLAVSAATQVVLPFHDASQSGSVLYSMTHGRCVVTTDVGELSDTVREFGLIVPPGDPGALADAMAIAADDPERCDSLGEAARAHVLEELDWTRLARLTLAAYAGADSHAPPVDAAPLAKRGSRTT